MMHSRDAEPTRSDRHAQALAVALLQLRRAGYGLGDGHVDQVNRTAISFRPILGEGDIVTKDHLCHIEGGLTWFAAVCFRSFVVGKHTEASAIPVAGAQVGASESRCIELLNR